MKAAIHIYLSGDLTMCCYDESVAPRAGWGQKLGALLAEGTEVCNEAASGRSHFSEEGAARMAELVAQGLRELGLPLLKQ